MSARVFRDIRDFARHRQDVELECELGHVGVVPWREVVGRFSAMGWSGTLAGAVWLPSAHRRFYCSRCRAMGRGKRRPVRIGPGER